MYTFPYRVSFIFLPKGGGGQNEIVWGFFLFFFWGGEGGGGKYVFVCKACGKLGGPGGMLSQEILILDLLLDAIWWNRFTQT